METPPVTQRSVTRYSPKADLKNQFSLIRPFLSLLPLGRKDCCEKDMITSYRSSPGILNVLGLKKKNKVADFIAGIFPPESGSTVWLSRGEFHQYVSGSFTFKSLKDL